LPDGSSLTFEDIKIATSIPEQELVRHLLSLAVAPKTRVLLKSPMSREIKNDDRFCFNSDFTSPMTRIRIVAVAGARTETAVEKRETSERIDEMRNIQIEATIVRIMKDRKRLDHNNLVAEVIKQLKSRFQPAPNLIKRRIEALIEREYLERDEDRTTYQYLA